MMMMIRLWWNASYSVKIEDEIYQNIEKVFSVLISYLNKNKRQGMKLVQKEELSSHSD